MKKLALLFLSIFSLNSFAAFTDQDVKAAKYISEIERSIKRSRTNNKKLQASKKAINSSKVFKHYLEDIDDLIHYNKLSSQKKFFTCNTSIKGHNSNHRVFKVHSLNYCFDLFVRNISDSKEQELTKNEEFVKKAITHYLTSSNKRFIRSLSKLDKKKSTYSFIRSLLIEVSLEEGISPQDQFYDHFNFNSDLTFLIQKNIHSLKRNRLIFTREFLSIYKDFNNAYKERENYKEIAEQLLAFQFQNRNFIYHKTGWKKLLYVANKLERTNDLEKAQKIYNYLITSSVGNDQYNDAVFKTLWTNITRYKYSAAIKDIERLNLIDNYSNLDSKVKFWIAYSLNKEGETSIANHLFKLLVKNNPLNYYSIISQSFVPNLSVDNIMKKYGKKKKKSQNINLSDIKEKYSLAIDELLIWQQLKYSRKTTILIKDFINKSPKDLLQNKELLSDYDNDELSVFVHNFFINLFKKNNDFLSSFKYISMSLERDNINPEMLNLEHLFPTKFLPSIKTADNTIDPYLILSIIRQESAFNPDAKSHVGARGLMQLMPDTARSLIRFRSLSDLNIPETNIKAGVKYFKKLLTRFDGNLVYALSSYNAGPTKVSRWIKNRFKHQDPIHLIEEIPYNETQMYVKLIYRNLFFYNLLNNNYLLDKSIKKTFKVSLNTLDTDNPKR